MAIFAIWQVVNTVTYDSHYNPCFIYECLIQVIIQQIIPPTLLCWRFNQWSCLLFKWSSILNGDSTI